MHVVNLDLGAENFDYPLAMDIRELISLDDVIEELGLGPNGDLMYCMKHLEENLDDWFTEELDDYLDDDYLVFDYPGKISFLWYGPTPGLIIMSPELFKDVFNKPYDFTKRHLSPLSTYVAPGIIKYDGDKWANNRKIISPAFTLDKLKIMTETFFQSGNDMIREWEKMSSSSSNGASCEMDVWPSLMNMIT